MNYTTIFFDLDGTLIDPKVGITRAIQFALTKFGIKEDPETLIPFIGPPLNKSFQKFYGFDEKKFMEAVVYYRKYFHPIGMYESTVYKGIPELLRKLKKADKKLSIVTSKPTFLAEKIVKHHDLDIFFENIVGSKPDLSNADKKYLVEEALFLSPNEKKSSVVMIGDREHDIIGAKANAIDSVGITYGYGSFEELQKAKATNIVKTVRDLESFLINSY